MQILGIHFDRPYIRCAGLEIKRKKSTIQCLKSLAAGNVKPLYIANWKGSIATGLSTMARPLDFKISSAKHIEQGLPFQMETLTHMNLEELVYDAQIRLHESGAHSTVFFAPKESLKNLLKKWSDLSIDLDIVTASPEALVQFSLFRYPELSSAFLVDLGSQEWTCVWMEKGVVKKSFTIQEGIESLLLALWEDRKKVLFSDEAKGVAEQIDLLQLKSHSTPMLAERLAALRNQLSFVLCSFCQAGGAGPVLFTGRTDAFGHLPKVLLEGNPELSIFDPPLLLSFEESKCAMAIGFALAGAAKESLKVQFLKKEFTSKKTWRKAGYWGIGLTFASLFLSVSLAYLGNQHFLQIRQEMGNSLQTRLEKTDATFANSLLIGGIDAGMNQAFRAIQKYDTEAPYLLTSPTVSEALSWLFSHPLLEAERIAGNPLEILDIKYHLISYPHIGALQDSYQAKIELEFRTKSPINARKFHEMLLQGDPLIDSTQEISWESLSNSYKTSFYLKNRPPHVPSFF